MGELGRHAHDDVVEVAECFLLFEKGLRDETIEVLVRHPIVQVERGEFDLDLLVLERARIRVVVALVARNVEVLVAVDLVDLAGALFRGGPRLEVVGLGAILQS
jgi:hypothetical protein